MDDARQPNLQTELQCGDPVRESAALRTLIGLLLEHAARELRARWSPVDTQTDLIEGHTVARELAEGRDSYRRFEHHARLYARVRLAVSHRIRDVLRGHRKNARPPGQHVREEGDAQRCGSEPAARSAGTAGDNGRLDSKQVLEARSAASRERLLEAAPAEERELVRLVIIEGRPSEVAGRELGIPPDNVRNRMSRLRRRLRERLLRPVMETLSEDDQALVEAVFIDRLDLDLLTSDEAPSRPDASRDEFSRGDVAAMLARRVEELLRTPFVERLGDDGVTYLDRLLGRPRPTPT